MLPDILKFATALFCLFATIILMRRQWADMEPAARARSQRIFSISVGVALVLAALLFYGMYALSHRSVI
jgi:hypothetical protein